MAERRSLGPPKGTNIKSVDSTSNQASLDKPLFNSRLSLILTLGKRMECSPDQALQGSAVCQHARHLIGTSVTKLLTRLDYIFAITTLILLDACNNGADKYLTLDSRKQPY